MDWTDQGIVLSARKHGESAAIVQLLTHAHGRHAGLVHGGAGSKGRGVLQLGNRLEVAWRARLAEHLGTYTCEQLHSGAATLLDDPLRLAALASVCALAEAALPEREPHPAVYQAMVALIAAFESTDRVAGWGRAAIAWEMGLLTELGFGLDLSSCAATGHNDDLIYVSPRTGRAVSRHAGEIYKERLLKLPGFLAGPGAVPTDSDILEGLDLTGHFLERHVFAALHRETPPARTHFLERLRRALRKNGENGAVPPSPPSD
jgi:DNA repair protein RecO (recombination protein O)